MTKNYTQGDIVVIPWPYDDLTGTKKRPVIIVSKDNFSKEYFIVAKITSVLRGDDHEFPFHNTELETDIPKPSAVRINQVFTAHESLILKKVSKLKKTALTLLTEKIKTNFDVE
jgi:mRNA interferase MazF